MKRIAASRFEAMCLELIDHVSQTGEPIVITKRGKPVARLVPAEITKPSSIFGAAKASMIYLAPDEELFTTGVTWNAVRT